MGRKLIGIAGLFLLQVLCARAQVEKPQVPIVQGQSGVLQGIRFGSEPNAAAFLGIPYASPPTGELRWKPPLPAAPWAGTRQAITFGSPCAQLSAPWLRYIQGSEDCLYLNVWTTDLQPNANRPVLVYFHGGSNAVGYSQMTPLGPPLSRLGLVVVSANYRLGPFGFLSHPALTEESEHHSSGNYGLLDQLQALKWVKQNIREFGGDPDLITVMGQSAGAVDICLLMASPLSQGLFQRAILESGECQDTLNEDIRKPINYNFIATTGEAAGERLVKDLDVSEGPEVLKKLRRIPAVDILAAMKNDPGLHFDAIVDGWIVPRQPAQIYAGGSQMHIPILVGSNADEATVFGHNDLKTIDDYKKHLGQDTGKYSDQEFQLYPVNSGAQVLGESIKLESDEFACGAYSIAMAMAKTGVNAYLYYFTYVDPGKRSRLGAHHGEELFFLGESFPADWMATAEDRKLGELIRNYWAEFVKTGDPNFADAPHWSWYDNKSRQYFELGARVGDHPISHDIQNLEAIMKHVVTQGNDRLTKQQSTLSKNNHAQTVRH
jgi:para-nitrobenzyl esterase